MKRRKTKDPTTDQQTRIITAPIVSQYIVKENGERTDRKAYYLERSIQNYFIKFCESSVSQEDLEQHLAAQTGLIKTATLEVSFQKGAWDIGEDGAESQSRRGEYAIVHRIL